MIFPQELLGLSDDCLMHFYAVATDLVEKKDYEGAIAILTWLEMLAPYVSSFWLAHGLCLQMLNKHDEAIESLLIAKQFSLEDPTIIFNLYKSYSASKMHDLAKSEMKLLNALIMQLTPLEQSAWRDKINNLR